MRPRRPWLIAAVWGGGFLVLVLGAVIVRVAPPDVAQLVAASIGLAGVGLLLLTAGTGVAVAAATPPLPRVSDVSILGRRAVALTRFALAVAGVFGTALIATVVGESFAARRPATAIVDELIEALGVIVVAAAFVFWVWLLIDLFRLRREGRAAGVERVARWLGPRLAVKPDDIALVGGLLVQSPWVLAGAFALSPSAVGLAVAWFVSVGG